MKKEPNQCGEPVGPNDFFVKKRQKSYSVFLYLSLFRIGWLIALRESVATCSVLLADGT